MRRDGDLEGLEEHDEELEKELKEEREVAAVDGATPAPASAQARIEHSLEEDFFKT